MNILNRYNYDIENTLDKDIKNQMKIINNIVIEELQHIMITVKIDLNIIINIELQEDLIGQMLPMKELRNIGING